MIFIDFILAEHATLKNTHRYVALIFSRIIGRYNASTGATINSSVFTGLGSNYGMAISGNSLNVVSGATTIKLYDATTGSLITAGFISGLVEPQGIFLVTSAVPEPSTYVAIFGGLALGLTWFVRRRKA